MNKKNIIFSILLFFAIGSSHAQTYIILVKVQGSKTWQYANLKGEIIIDRKDERSFDFSSEGIAVVNNPKKNLYQFINTKGEVIPTEVEDFELTNIFGYGVKGFSDGLVVVGKNKKFGCLNTQGKIAIPLKYDYLTEFNNGHAIGKRDGTFFVVSKKGKETPIEEKEIDDIKHFQENLAPISTKKGKFGFVDTTGKIVIPIQYDGVGYFTNGLAWARNNADLVGFINPNGSWAIKPQFLAVKDFDKESGMAMVKVGESWGYVNELGKIFSFPISDKTERYFEGLAEGKKGNLSGFYNNKGEWVIQPKYEDVRKFTNGFAAAKSGGLWGIINKEGTWIINPKFEAIKDVVKVE